MPQEVQSRRVAGSGDAATSVIHRGPRPGLAPFTVRKCSSSDLLVLLRESLSRIPTASGGLRDVDVESEYHSHEHGHRLQTANVVF